MKNILIANPKGGSGKTTLATNLVGYYAKQGHAVLLSDLDRQQSSTLWVQRRPAHAPLIELAKNKSTNTQFDWNIIDSPGGFRNEKLSESIKLADCVIVPIQPSAFDMSATEDFLNILIEEKAIRKQKTFVALVGMRVNSRTNATAKLAEFMGAAHFPVLTSLRNAQCYVTAAELGLSIFDMRPSQVNQDLAQWQPLTEWLMDVAVS